MISAHMKIKKEKFPIVFDIIFKRSSIPSRLVMKSIIQNETMNINSLLNISLFIKNFIPPMTFIRQIDIWNKGRLMAVISSLFPAI